RKKLVKPKVPEHREPPVSLPPPVDYWHQEPDSSSLSSNSNGVNILWITPSTICRSKLGLKRQPAAPCGSGGDAFRRQGNVTASPPPDDFATARSDLCQFSGAFHT